MLDTERMPSVFRPGHAGYWDGGDARSRVGAPFRCPPWPGKWAAHALARNAEGSLPPKDSTAAPVPMCLRGGVRWHGCPWTSALAAFRRCGLAVWAWVVGLHSHAADLGGRPAAGGGGVGGTGKAVSRQEGRGAGRSCITPTFLSFFSREGVPVGSAQHNCSPAVGHYSDCMITQALEGVRTDREGSSGDPKPKCTAPSPSPLPPSDVLERPYTVGGPWTPLPFPCLRLTAKILLRPLRCQEDLRFKNCGLPSAGTIGGPWEEGGPSQPPSSPPFRPPPPFPLPPF